MFRSRYLPFRLKTGAAVKLDRFTREFPGKKNPRFFREVYPEVVTCLKIPFLVNLPAHHHFLIEDVFLIHF